MAKDRRPILTTFADKIAVRHYVAEVVGPAILPALYEVASDPDQLDRKRLPAECVIKPSHASGLTLFLADQASLVQLAPRSIPDRVTTKQALDWDQFVATSRRWLAMRYSDVELEWAYRNVSPRLMVEELLRDVGGGLPPDYKFFVFNGRVGLVQVDTDRFRDHRRNLFSPDWRPVEARLLHPPADSPPPQPNALDEMIWVAEALGQETDFVRVDLFNIEDRVVFGELTSYPEGPNAAFSPPSFDQDLGHYWVAPRRYR
jgi:hypothetical protein